MLSTKAVSCYKTGNELIWPEVILYWGSLVNILELYELKEEFFSYGELNTFVNVFFLILCIIGLNASTLFKMLNSFNHEDQQLALAIIKENIK